MKKTYIEPSLWVYAPNIHDNIMLTGSIEKAPTDPPETDEDGFVDSNVKGEVNWDNLW